MERLYSISTQTTVVGTGAGHSITYRIAVGPQQGRKAFTHVRKSVLTDDQFLRIRNLWVSDS